MRRSGGNLCEDDDREREVREWWMLGEILFLRCIADTSFLLYGQIVNGNMITTLARS